VLTRVLPNPCYVHITREDKIRQAVSLARARQSDRWVRFKEGATQGNYARQHKERLETFFADIGGLPSETERALAYDFPQIRTIYTMLLEHERGWEQFFADAGVRPHRVVYEHLAADYEGTTLSLLSNMGLPVPSRLPSEDRVLDRQGDEVNDEWRSRFADDLREGRGASGGGA
jgi:LPS sulfotransferase NodH